MPIVSIYSNRFNLFWDNGSGIVCSLRGRLVLAVGLFSYVRFHGDKLDTGYRMYSKYSRTISFALYFCNSNIFILQPVNLSGITA